MYIVHGKFNIFGKFTMYYIYCTFSSERIFENLLLRMRPYSVTLSHLQYTLHLVHRTSTMDYIYTVYFVEIGLVWIFFQEFSFLYFENCLGITLDATLPPIYNIFSTCTMHYVYCIFSSEQILENLLLRMCHYFATPSHLQYTCTISE